VPTPHARTGRTLLTAIVLLLAAHWLLFATYVRREIASVYALNFDQTSSLFIAYRTWEDSGQRGLPTALGEALRRAPPSGATAPLEAVLVFLVTGPSRLGALTVNWLHFALLLGAVAWALWATSRRWELPVLGLGLLLSVRAPFFWAGGIADFRPDFIGFCLYGTFLAVVWRSDMFRLRAWTIVAGAVAALCVVSRSLTGVYLGALLGAWLARLSILRWRATDPARRQDLGRQLMGAALCAAEVCLVAGPVLAVRARALWLYYFVGPTGKDSAVWAAFAGPTLGERIVFYPRSALFDHGGTLFLGLAAGALVILEAARRLDAGAGSVRDTRDSGPGGGWFMAGALLVPLGILTAYVSKSPVVGGLLVMPLLWLILVRGSRLVESAPRRLAQALALSVLVAGATAQAAHLRGPAPRSLPADAVAEVLRLHDDILRWSLAQGWPRPVLLHDRQHEHVHAIPVSAYERHGRVLALQRPIGDRVLRVESDEVLETLRRSHFVILTRPQPAAPFGLPYDASLAEMYPRLLAYCKRNLVRVGNYRLPDEVMLFARAPGGGNDEPAPPSQPVNRGSQAGR
jgi:hypothetical protein